MQHSRFFYERTIAMQKKKDLRGGPRRKAEEAARAFTDASSEKRDPNGSWTGKPKDGGPPEQDADDI